MRNLLDDLIDRNTTEPQPEIESGGVAVPEPKEPPKLKPLLWIPQSFNDGDHRRYMERLKSES